MVKEHFIKTYGKPIYTIGWGESGGAFNQYLAAQNYPGLLDGLIAGLSFPDALTSNGPWVMDCTLLDHAFNTSKRSWNDVQKAAVVGFSSWQTCMTRYDHGRFWPIVDPTLLCPALLPKEAIYDRRANPKGVRCDFYDNEINVLGRNPRTGFANRPLDNVGVQYGLLAFNSGQIDAEQFIELNERIGGLDDDGGIVSTRTAADPEVLSLAYQRGVVLTGGGGLKDVPIIDWRQYNDDSANDHDSARSFVTRERLIAANGNADNQVILRFPRWSIRDWLLFTTFNRWEEVYPDQTRYVVHQMDRWLQNITTDGSNDTLATKVVRDKPAELADACWAANGERIVEHATYHGEGRCNQQYPTYGDPRIAAGGPLTDDTLKCVLKPIRAEDYSQYLTSEQLARLNAVFPTGICDYSRPGVGQAVNTTTWQQF